MWIRRLLEIEKINATQLEIDNAVKNITDKLDYRLK
jgi:hypothetical protein